MAESRHEARRGPDADEILRAASAAFRDQRFDVVLELTRHLLDAGPDLGSRWREVADLASGVSDAECAAAAERRALEAGAAEETGHNRLAQYLMRTGRIEEALEIAEAALERHPDSAGLMSQTGMLHFFGGDYGRAAALFRQALERDPDSHESWRLLAKIEPLEPGGDEALEMERLAERLIGDGKPLAASAVEFALGELHEKAGDIYRASDYYRRAQDRTAAARPYPLETERAFVEEIKAVFDEGLYERARESGQGHPSERPIFLVSLPRSGSTLVEQMLSRHSAVAGGGELEAMRLAAYPLGDYSQDYLDRFVRTLGGAEGGPFGALGARYLQFVGEQFDAEGRVVDKSLDLPYYAGAALAAFPNASFLWLERDPRDAALSIYRTPLPQRHDWSWSWERIANHIVNVQALKRHFTSIFPERILSIDYEALVAEPEGETARLLAHCGLAGEPVHADFHESARPVMTASTMQVRRPLSASSVGAWRRWQALMQPFFETFEAIWPEDWGDPYRD